jgi:hypothetical protein
MPEKYASKYLPSERLFKSQAGSVKSRPASVDRSKSRASVKQPAYDDEEDDENLAGVGGGAGYYKPTNAKTPMPPMPKDKYGKMPAVYQRLYGQPTKGAGGSKSRPASAERAKSRAGGLVGQRNGAGNNNLAPAKPRTRANSFSDLQVRNFYLVKIYSY